MIDLQGIADNLWNEPDGTWNSGAAGTAWEQLQLAADSDPLNALAIVALVVHHVSRSAAAKVASKVLRPIIEYADATVAARLAEYRQNDDSMRDAIEAVDQYLQKVSLLQAALRSGRLPCLSMPSASSFPLPNAYDNKPRLGDVFPPSAPPDVTGDADELFDAFDVLVSNSPAAAWQMVTQVAMCAVTDRDRLIVAQSLSRLLNLNEGLIAADLTAKMRASRSLRQVMAYCRYAISERLLDEMLCIADEDHPSGMP